jgi:HopA1 effector protein family
MPGSAADLREMVGAVTIRSPTTFTVGEDTLELPAGDGSGSESGRGRLLTDHLANALYRRLYCRPQRGHAVEPASHRGARSFVERLSEANSGRGTWEPGWVVRAVEADGSLVVHKQTDDLTLWARPDQFRPRSGAAAPGAVGRLWLGKELREMLPGYYMALGDADQEDHDPDSPPSTVRFYFHLAATGAELWVRELTGRLNDSSVPFHAKLHSHPAMYLRADAAVLYIARSDLARTMTIMPAFHAAVARHLRFSTPIFTKRLARGLAVAEDPGDGRSFGQHRCGLVAEALVRHFENGGTTVRGAAKTVVGRFAEAGLDARRPWLNAGSPDAYAWPPPPKRRPTTQP